MLWMGSRMLRLLDVAVVADFQGAKRGGREKRGTQRGARPKEAKGH
jgi:hypothetical protein